VTQKGQGRDVVIFDNSARETGSQLLITTSTPVTINIILDLCQIDARSLIQVERNEKSI